MKTRLNIELKKEQIRAEQISLKNQAGVIERNEAVDMPDGEPRYIHDRVEYLRGYMEALNWILEIR